VEKGYRVSLTDVINQFFVSPEFANLAPTICGSNLSYHFDPDMHPAIALPTSTSGDFQGGTGDQL